MEQRQCRRRDFRGAGNMLKTSAIADEQTSAIRTRPYSALGIFGNSPHVLILQTFTFPKMFPLASLQPINPGPFRADPQPAATSGADSRHRLVLPVVRGVHRATLDFAHHRQTAATSACPQIAFAVLTQDRKSTRLN